LLASVLLDISQSAAIEASMDLGVRMLRELGGLGKLHKSSVQRAGFAVLKAPDVPSILVETAFISNPAEEARLRDGKEQDKLARGLLNGILSYFETYRPQRLVAQASP
jgi:N-acetylmuramoyl-L-alanine amidase